MNLFPSKEIVTEKGVTGDREDEYYIVHKSTISELTEKWKCSICGSRLDIIVSDVKGFARTLTAKCAKCDEIFGKACTSPRMVNKQDSTRPPFDVNRKMVEAFITLGLGHAGLQKFGMEMGMTILAETPWKTHLRDIESKTAELKRKILDEAHTAVRQVHKCEEGQLDLTVSTDGTWQKRGHVSNHGAGFVIEEDTGLVIDYEVLSRYCQICSVKAASIEEGSQEFEEWMTKHKELGECQINHTGSAGAIESSAAVSMWKRSEDQFQLRYTTMTADGDTSSLADINKAKPYGPNIDVDKEQCINHVAKRMKKGLQGAVETCKAQKIKLGGKGEGKLTEPVIDKLTSYYRNAIVNNMPDISVMRDAVMATFYHCTSTDDKPNHKLCPKGVMLNDKKENWCKYNKSKELKQKPESHEKMSLKLNETVAKHIKPVYERLSDEKIIGRCTLGVTQNANESLHSVVWKFCPKEVFVSRPKLEVAVARAVAEFNMGSVNALIIRKDVAGEKVPATSRIIARKRDLKRQARSSRQKVITQEKFKRKLQSKRKAALAKKKKGALKEYEAGGFL